MVQPHFFESVIAAVPLLTKTSLLWFKWRLITDTAGTAATWSSVLVKSARVVESVDTDVTVGCYLLSD